MEIDHVFVCTARGAPVAGRLRALGLAEGSSSVHPGQGTANRRFFFANAMLELLWVRNSIEARSRTTQRTRLLERWNGRTGAACPFGICFRPVRRHSPPAFRTWDYAPEYLQAPLRIGVAANSQRLDEPMLFHIPFGTRPDAASGDNRQPLEHACGLREITRVRWVGPRALSLSAELRAALSCRAFSVGHGAEHRLEIGFDGEKRGESVTLAPELPVTLHW